MEIKSYKKKKNSKYEVIFKDDSSIELYDDVIIKYNLLVDKKIDSKKLENIVKYNASLDAYYLSLKYLNSKMRTKLEIKNYLEKKGIDNITISNTIAKLEKNKAIDEETYLKSYVNDQIRFKNYGPHKIVSNLNALGISKEDSYLYLETIDDDIWKEKIKKLIAKKINSNNNYSVIVLKNKIVNFLINEGYDKWKINSILQNFEFKEDMEAILKEYNKQKRKLSKKYDGEALEFQIRMKLKAKGFTNKELEKIKIGD